MQQQEAFICFSLYSFTLIMNNWKKKFIIIWSGQLFSILSSSIAQFSIVLWISLKTGSAEVLSFAMIAALLPQALLGAFAGVYVDRWNRKWTMIGADSFVAFINQGKETRDFSRGRNCPFTSFLLDNLLQALIAAIF